ncbi:MAG: biotin--[acetyl-CoA-carboxylase] ligase [Ignavibacteriae bacterium]|nr:biotin--[acetyl-CoA-carboxylase] ligase [Ignavibacteria bacterium]MBI3363970.1 biotin--[acetyl-CoA-carboxylase] ligase [Ignavibacteriota bacterium]
MVEIAERLTTRTFGRRIFSFDSIDSTNSFAKNIAHEVEEGTLVIAEEQTAGRGRLGRSWQSERENNLTFSIIIKPDILAEHLGVLSLYAGLAVTEALQAQTQLVPHCKWPNDVLIGGKKCCGILSESTLAREKATSVVIGIGINVNQSSFPDDILATSLSLEAGRVFDRVNVLAAVLAKLEEWYRCIRMQEYTRIIDAWKSHAPMLGRHMRIKHNDDVLEGIARRIETDGSLILQSNGRELKLTAGDVSILNK